MRTTYPLRHLRTMLLYGSRNGDEYHSLKSVTAIRATCGGHLYFYTALVPFLTLCIIQHIFMALKFRIFVLGPQAVGPLAGAQECPALTTYLRANNLLSIMLYDYTSMLVERMFFTFSIWILKDFWQHFFQRTADLMKAKLELDSSLWLPKATVLFGENSNIKNRLE